MGKKPYYYAVQNGRHSGVYNSWAECQVQTKGFAGAVFKKFSDESSARSFSQSTTGYFNHVSSSSSGSSSYSNQSSNSQSSYKSGRSTSHASSQVSSHGSSHVSSYGSSFGSSNARSYQSSPFASTPSYSTASYSSYPETQPTAASSSKKPTYYAVADGKTPGIYQTWDECLRQTSGVSGAKYKKFDDLTSAQNFISESRPSSKRGPDHSSYSTSSSKKSSQSYYAVNYENGQSDLFTNWNDCKRAVDGKKGVTYKKFDSFASAEKFTQSHGHDNSSQSEKQDAMDCYLRSYSNQHLESQRKAPVSHIFMDGSYMPIGRGKCGYGVYFGPNDPRNLAEPVNGVHVTDSFVGEVHATRAALNTIKNDIKSFESGQQSIIPKYVLSTDSETVIGILTKYAPTWSEKEFEQRSAGSELKEAYVMYKEVQDFYNRHSEVMDNHKFEIKWVKGHSGIDGNEAADQLAKAGAMKS